MIETYKTISQNLLYASVIENDGHVGKQMTFLGSVLTLAAAVVIGAAAFLAVGYLIAVFS
jgi:hypothetical protein